MKFLNLVTKKQEDIELKDTVKINKNNFDFIISNPHSGVYFPQEYVDNFNINRWMFISSDLYTDEVFKIENSGVQIYSLINKFIPNLNISIFDSKNLIGHTYLNNTPSLKKKVSEQEQKEILKNFYFPYHNMLTKLIKEMINEKGFGLVIDGHSMNSVGFDKDRDKGKKRPDFSIGTRNDSSCEKEISDHLCKELTKEFPDLVILKNKPYRGAFITRNYGIPERKVNVIQIEVRKTLFMDEETFEKDNEKIKEINEKLLKAVESTAKFAEEFYK